MHVCGHANTLCNIDHECIVAMHNISHAWHVLWISSAVGAEMAAQAGCMHAMFLKTDQKVKN